MGSAPATVSVALCTCNGRAYVAEQVSSICAQTRPASEIVLYDDASDDDTVARAVAAWEAAAGPARPALRVHRNPLRLGVAANFVAALQACRGDLIALSDQDDRWHPQHLERLAGRLARDPDALLVHSDARLVGAAGDDLGETLLARMRATPHELARLQHGHAFWTLLDRNLVTGATVLLRRDLLADALPVPAGWLHDEWMGLVAAVLGGLRLEPQPLLDYRLHGANQVGARRETPWQVWQRARSVTAAWYAHRVQRAQALARHMDRLGLRVPLPVHQAVYAKLQHHRVRAALPTARLRRLWPVLREWRSGRYGRFGRGLRGVLLDLLARH